MARLVERWHNRCTKFGQRFAQAWFSGHWSVKRSNGAHRIEWNDYLHKYWNRRNRVNTDKASATHRIDWAEHLYKYWNRHMQANNDKTSKASEEDYGDTLSDNRSVNWTWSVTFELSWTRTEISFHLSTRTYPLKPSPWPTTHSRDDEWTNFF